MAYIAIILLCLFGLFELALRFLAFIPVTMTCACLGFIPKGILHCFTFDLADQIAKAQRLQ